MTKIKNLKSFVKKNAPWLIAGAAVSVSIAVVVKYESKTLMEITPEQVARLIECGGFYNFRAFNTDLAVLTKNQLQQAIQK